MWLERQMQVWPRLLSWTILSSVKSCFFLDFMSQTGLWISNSKFLSMAVLREKSSSYLLVLKLNLRLYRLGQCLDPLKLFYNSFVWLYLWVSYESDTRLHSKMSFHFWLGPRCSLLSLTISLLLYHQALAFSCQFSSLQQLLSRTFTFTSLWIHLFATRTSWL